MIQAADEGRLSVEQVFALHCRHWHASGYLVMIGLGSITAYSQFAEIVANLVLACLVFLGVFRLAERQINAVTPRKDWGFPAAVIALFVFSLDQSQNWLWGWQTAVFAHLVGVVWCIERLTRDRLRLGDIIFACAMAALAIYGFGTGWALIPIASAILIARKLLSSDEGWGGLAIWSAFSILILWHMSLAVQAQDIAQVTSSEVAGAQSPVYAYGLYAMNYVASAVTRFSPDIAVPVFLLSAAVAIWCGLLFWRTRKVDILKLAPALALMAYAFGSGLLTSFGRLDAFGADTAFLGRYISFANMYWLGLISLVFAGMSEMGQGGRRGVHIYVVLLCLMKLGTIGNVVGSAVPHAVEVRHTIAKVRACYPNVDQADLAKLFGAGQIDKAKNMLEYLHDNKLSLFAAAPEPGIVCADG